MDIDAINYTAENQLLSNLCLQYYQETDNEKKSLILIEIQVLALKKMKDREEK